MSIRDFALTGTVFLTELKSGLRDRHVVIYSLVLPLFLYPAIFWFMAQGAQFRMGALEKQISRVAWDESAEALCPELFAGIREDSGFVHTPSSNPEMMIENGDLDAMLRIVETEEGGPLVEAYFDLSHDRSSTTRKRILRVCEVLRHEMLLENLAPFGETEESIRVLDVLEENVASAKEMGRFLLSLFLPMMLVIMLAMGAMYPAIDVLVGEKERKTLEGLLSSGAPRMSIITGKFLVVVAASLSALVINLISMLFTLSHQASFFGEGDGLSIGIPWNAIPVILFSGLLLGSFISASMILIASFARTFKEGQGYVTPFYMICIIPGIAASMPGLELKMSTALIPLLNVTLLFRSALLGVFPVLPIILVFLSLLVYLGVSLWAAQYFYGREDFILAARPGRGLLSRFKLPSGGGPR